MATANFTAKPMSTASSKVTAEEAKKLADCDEEFQAALRNGTVTLFITKCGVSGPPGTGKSHIRALMLGKSHPQTRQSTALATEADQATSDIDRIPDNCDLINAGKWKVISDDGMARLIANTIHDRDYKKEKCSAMIQGQDPSVSPELDTTCLNKTSRKISNGIKGHLILMHGKPKRKRKGLNRIHLVYFVDAGGQQQFLEILPKFVRSTINLLVHDLSQKLTDCPQFSYEVDGKKFSVPEKMQVSNMAMIEQSVRSSISSKGKPQIAIMGTFKDKWCQASSSSYNTMLKEKSIKINRCLEPYIGSKKCGLICPNRSQDQIIFDIDGSLEGWNTNGDTIDKLKGFIEASKSSVELPIRYYLFLLILKSYATSKKVEYLSLDDCINIALHSHISMSDSDVIDSLKLFNDVNLILYFPDIMESVVFVKPEFLFQKVTELIVASFCCDRYDVITEERREFYETGIFTNKILQHTKSLQLTDSKFTQENLLELLKRLFIIADIGNGQYFMPCVLPSLEESSLIGSDEKKLEEVQKRMKENGIEGPLMISFAFKTSPRGLFCAVVVVLVNVSSWKLSDEGKNTFRRRNLVEFDIYSTDSTYSIGKVVIIDKNSHLEIYTTCEKNICPELRQIMENSVLKGCESLSYSMDNLAVTIGFPCKISCGHQELHVAGFEYAVKKKQWTEKCSLARKNAVPLSPGRAIWFNCTKQDESPKEQDTAIDTGKEDNSLSTTNEKQVDEDNRGDVKSNFSRPSSKGTKTPQYTAIKRNYADLKLSLEHVLDRVAAKCFQEDLIAKDDRDTANNQSKLKSVRSGGLVDTILDKIESHIKWYEVFMTILKEFTELDDIVQDITTSFTTAFARSDDLLVVNEEQSTVIGTEDISTDVHCPTIKKLTLMKWKDSQGQSKEIRIIKESSHKWKNMGDLLEIPPAELKSFQVKYLNSNEDCYREVLLYWLDGKGSPSYPVTWDGFYELLDDTELVALAKKLSEALQIC